MEETPVPKLLLLNSTAEVPPGRYRYYQSETKTPIGPFSTIGRLLAAVKQHRESNRIPLGTAWKEEVQDWMCRHMDSADVYCHEAGRSPRDWGRGGVPATRAGTGYDGSEKWKQLHTYALVERPTQQARAVWLSEFARSLPCGECKQGWRALNSGNPLAVTATPEEFFVWTWKMHNAVNEKLGKSQITLDEARQIWSR